MDPRDLITKDITVKGVIASVEGGQDVEKKLALAGMGRRALARIKGVKKPKIKELKERALAGRRRMAEAVIAAPGAATATPRRRRAILGAGAAGVGLAGARGVRRRRRRKAI